MATKWRSKTLLGLWAFMITFGISGIYVLFSFGNQYIYRDYFHTPDFRHELRHFAMHVDLFELNNVTSEHAKQSIEVTDADIEEYRNGFGNLMDHVSYIQTEYDSRILEALAMDNQDSVDFYKTERDN
ncbi:MAG: walK, partial [Paenibacillus sp.]|nr:walK [Paenibacillus sp.]